MPWFLELSFMKWKKSDEFFLGFSVLWLKIWISYGGLGLKMCINTIANFGAESKVHKKLFLKINQKTQLELRLLIFKAKVRFFKSLKIFICKLENGHLKYICKLGVNRTSVDGFRIRQIKLEYNAMMLRNSEGFANSKQIVPFKTFSK